MKRYIVFFSISVIILLISCNSNNTNSNTKQEKNISMNTSNSTITSGNIVQKVVDSVKSYPQEPLYYIFVHNYFCYYEILVNDFPVDRFFEKGTLATPIFLNMAILRSGKQKLTYRMYPIGETFIEDTKMEINLSVMDNRIGFDSEKDIVEHRNAYTVKMVGEPKDIRREIFIAAGEKYYEHTFEFNAAVPYENKGWLDGQDLRKFNQDSLYQAVLRYYKGYKKIYDNKDADRLALLNFRSIVEFSQSEYKTEKEIQEMWDEYLKMLNIEKEFFPMDNIKMSFYGDGRIVCLEQANTEDIRLRGKSAFFFLYKAGNQRRSRSSPLFLCLPRGKKDLTELEIGG